MTFRLAEVQFSPRWRGFLASLPGWHEVDQNCWVGAGAIARTKSGTDNTLAILDIVDSQEHGLQMHASRDDVVTTSLRHAVFKTRADSATAVLNHVAVDMPLAEEQVAKLFRAKDVQCFLDRAGRFDPSEGKSVVAEHLIGPAGDYLTLRYLPKITRPRLAHVGFQFASPDAFMAHESIISDFGWPKLWGPDLVDGSLVIHFRGPDGLVHDLFCIVDPVPSK